MRNPVLKIEKKVLKTIQNFENLKITEKFLAVLDNTIATQCK